MRAAAAPRGRRLTAVIIALLAAGSLPAAGAQGEERPAPRPDAPAGHAVRVDRLDTPVERDRAGGLAHASGIAPFRMIGVQLAAAPPGEIEVRVHAHEGWTPWQELEVNPDEAPDGPEGRASTAVSDGQASTVVSEPLWVGDADGYQVRLPSGTELDGLQVLAVRETGDPLPATPTTRASALSPDQPPILSRSSWGARAYRGTPLAADHLRLGIVHHSVTANDYGTEDVPGIIRSIQAYHMDAMGWYDIAYNFVVDRFGRIWEGRQGGIDRAIIGGHAKGFNTGSTGVVVLGEFTATRPSTAARNAVGELLGWKLFHHGVDPSGHVDFTTYGNELYPAGAVVHLPRIVGHRDTGATACPGSLLYADLASIRSTAAATYSALVGSGSFRSVHLGIGTDGTPIVGDFDGDGESDVLIYASGAAPDTLLRGRSDGGFDITSVDADSTTVPLVGDFDGDYRDDIFWYGPGAAPDELWFGRASGTFSVVPITVGGTYSPVVGDFDDDDRYDILWYGPGAATDHVWYGQTDRVFYSPPIEVAGTYTPFVGDFDGDAHDDVFWYGPGKAKDALWLGGDERNFISRTAEVAGTYTPLVGDFTGDQRDDILWYGRGAARDGLWLGRTEGWFTSRTTEVSGTYTPLVGDITGGGFDDIVWYGPGDRPDRLWISTGHTTFHSLTRDVSGIYDPVIVQVGGDARADVLWYGPGSAPDVLWVAAD